VRSSARQPACLFIVGLDKPRAAPPGAVNYWQMRGLCLISAASVADRAQALLQCHVRPVPVSDDMVRMRSGRMFSPQGGRPDRIRRESEGIARDGTWTRAHARRRRAGNKLGSSCCRPARQVQQDRSCHGRRACPVVRRGGQRAGRAGSRRGIPPQTGGTGGQPGSVSLHPADLQAGMQPGLGPGTPGQPEAKLAALAAGCGTAARGSGPHITESGRPAQVKAADGRRASPPRRRSCAGRGCVPGALRSSRAGCRYRR
jgi:hypothetical protein